MKLLCVALALALAALLVMGNEIEQAERKAAGLPDWSEGWNGAFGPFMWSRAADLGEDVRFSDAKGLPAADGEYVWFYQFARNKRTKGLMEFVHARSNLVNRDAAIGYTVQPMQFLHNTTGAHNSKIVFGYINTTQTPFQHGDNADLAHLAKGDRVVVFFPVRKDRGEPTNQNNYVVNPHYSSQSPCVIEFKEGEMIHYEWFRDPKKLDGRVLFDMQPFFSGDSALKPGVSQPIMKFDIGADGAWTLRIKRDGTTKDDAASWDHVFTHESPGAKKYTVNLPADKNAWTMSLFSPGGSPTDTSEIVIGLKPYDRATGAPAAWADKRVRVRDAKQEKLADAIKAAARPK